MNDPLVYIDFAEDGSILYVGATTDYPMRCGQHAKESPWIYDTAHTALIHVQTKTAAHALERTLIAAHNPPNNWLGRSVPNPRPRPSREENIAAVNARKADYPNTVMFRRCREALNRLGEELCGPTPVEQSA